MTFHADARAHRCGRRSLLVASAAGLRVACFATVSVGLVYMHSDGDAWPSSNCVAGYVIVSMVPFFVGLDIATTLMCGSM